MTNKSVFSLSKDAPLTRKIRPFYAIVDKSGFKTRNHHAAYGGFAAETLKASSLNSLLMINGYNTDITQIHWGTLRPPTVTSCTLPFIYLFTFPASSR